MEERLIALAIPFFIIAMVVEWRLCLRKGLAHYYRLNDSLANLANGLGQEAIGIINKVIYIGVYNWVFQNYSFVSAWDVKSPLHWIAAFLIGDICYYWFHRASHRVNILVGSHVVHHQSEEYNLSVALRQSWLTRLYGWAFYLPMALIGIPTLMFAVIGGLNLIYQFWVHTRLINRMGFLENILVTPSHHRVHHGRNPEYVDKNYSGVFIWWDMLFGTFQREEKEVVYGVINQAKTWNPLWANFRYYRDTWQTTKNIPKFSDKIKLWLKPPEWRPTGNLTTPEVTPQSIQKYDVTPPKSLNPWLWTQFGICLILYFFATIFLKDLSYWHQAWLIGLTIWGLTNLGGMLELKRWRMVSQGLFFFALMLTPLALIYIR